MNMRNGWRGAMRRVAEVRTAGLTGLMRKPEKQIPRSARDDNADKRIEAAGETARRTVPLPSILTSGAPTLMRAGVMPKPTPANLRRFAEMPIARRAINTIKDRVAGMRWRIQPRQGRAMGPRVPTLSPKTGDKGGAPNEVTGSHPLPKAGDKGGAPGPESAYIPQRDMWATRPES